MLFPLLHPHSNYGVRVWSGGAETIRIAGALIGVCTIITLSLLL